LADDRKGTHMNKLRRNLITAGGIAALSAAFGINAAAADRPAPTEHKTMSKTLIVYYSHTGTVHSIAQRLAKMTGADTYEIKPKTIYDRDMWAAWDVAKAEQEQGILPPLITKIPNIDRYQQVILGIPVWGRTIANPMQTLLSQLDFQGKNVYVFWTFYDHDEKMRDALAQQIRNGHFTSGLPLTMNVVHAPGQLEGVLQKWLMETGLAAP
jgi:hypothetical protein